MANRERLRCGSLGRSSACSGNGMAVGQGYVRTTFFEREGVVTVAVGFPIRRFVHRCPSGPFAFSGAWRPGSVTPCRLRVGLK